MKPAKKWLYFLPFALLCLCVLSFLSLFMEADIPYQHPQWESISVVEEDGSLTPAQLDEYGQPLGIEEGVRFRYTTQLTDLPKDAILLLSCSGAQVVLRLDGTETFQGTGAASSLITSNQISQPLPTGAETCRLELDLLVMDPELQLYPPLVRVTSTWLEDADTMAYANLLGIPSGAYGLVFLLVCGLFLAGLAAGRRDWSLLTLACAAALLTFYQLNISCGYYFLPEQVNLLLSWRGFMVLTPLLLLAYLLLNRKRGFYRPLGVATIFAVVALLVAALVSFLQGGWLIDYLVNMPSQLAAGYWDGLVYWVTVYLTFACAGVSAFCLFDDILKTRTEAQAVSVSHHLMTQRYQDVMEGNWKTAAMRHEWNNQVTALHLLLREGKLEDMEQKLGDMTTQLTQLAPRQYTGNLVIDAILQKEEARAERMGVQFHVDAVVPRELEIDEGDLCSLLFNMLDNALEAAAQAEGTKEVWLRIHMAQGFLAIRCENTYSGVLRTDASGSLASTKPEGEAHGFGLRQMQAVAEKYHSMLDISYDGQRFTVQTAIKK